MFTLTCKSCSHNNDIDEFDMSTSRTEIRGTAYDTITIECPACGAHHHIEINEPSS